MNRKSIAVIAIATTGMAAFAVIPPLGSAAKAEVATTQPTIKQIMDKANKGPDSLFKKVMAGKADASDKQKLLDLYSGLSADIPPRGDKADWDDRTAALTKAAQAVVDDTSDAIPALKKAADCKGCHMLHQNKH